MESLSGKQITDIKDLYQSIYKSEEITEELINEEDLNQFINLLTEEEKKNIFRRAFDAYMKGPSKNPIGSAFDFIKGLTKKKKKENVNIDPTDKKKENVNINPNDKKTVIKTDNGKVDTSKVDTAITNVGSKETDTSSEIESDAKYAQSNKNMNRINKFGKSSVPKLVKSPMETGMGDGAAKARAMAKERIKSGKSIADVKKSNQDSMRAKAKARFDAFKAKRLEKKLDKQRDFDDPNKKMNRGESYTPYDIVLEYLLSSQQAATIEEANYIMTEMDAKTIQDIVS